jgi:hypothetical protein
VEAPNLEIGVEVPMEMDEAVIASPQPGPSHEDRPPTFRCRKCNERFTNRKELYLHGMSQHHQTGQGNSTLQPVPWTRRGVPPWISDETEDERLKLVYESNQPIILEPHQETEVQSVYNFPINNDFDIQQIMTAAQDVYDRQHRAFRLNLEFGLILVHTETGEYRYFKPFYNESLFRRPIYISRRSDLNRLKLRLQKLNINDFILRQRPDTKWKPFLITNVRLNIFHLSYTLGSVGIQLPDYLKVSGSIVCLDIDLNNKKAYKDHLCAFRCLAYHRSQRRQLETTTKVLFKQWLDFTKEHYPRIQPDEDPMAYDGLSLDQLPYFEKCFRVNVDVFHLKEDGVATAVYKSRCRFDETLYLNVHDKHVSYISNLSAYARKYQCRTCEMHFSRLHNMKQHQRRCTGQTKIQFPGGFYTAPKTVFDKLEEHGIDVVDRIFPWFLVYDFEAYLTPLKDTGNTEKLTWTHRHMPISVSVCSNVPDYAAPHCIVNEDPDSLTLQMVTYMRRIAERTYELAKEKLSGAFEQLLKQIESTFEPAAMEVDEAGGADEEWMLEQQTHRKQLLKLQEELEAYCKQTICLGFNSSKYDTNLIKAHLAKHLGMHVSSDKCFTVKRNNQYACISNGQFKFLDITQYLAPGTSYVKFLKAFDVVESKGFLPYEWFDSAEKLDYPELPPFGPAWHSSLKNRSVLDDGMKTPEENFEECQRLWRDLDMKTFRDYLIHYNNMDCGPFVQAVENLQKYYFERHIDIFKVSISVPGLARQMLFECGRQAGASFSLFDAANEDLYRTVKQNIIGGPSIIFNRYHKAGETHIRGNPSKPCQTICGFDANALYLYCLDKELPTGAFVRRTLENDFKPVKRDKYTIAYDWMDFVNQNQQLDIRHKLNEGKEKRVGPYPVDGYDVASHVIFQFHGCYFHGHDCWMTRDIKDEKWRGSREEKLKKTMKTTEYIISQGYQVVEMWECHFRNDIRNKPALKAFVESRKPQTPQRATTENEIMEGVISGQLFGMVEVDISVPEQWPSYFQHPSMTPYEYFQEMSPLFCSTEVPFEIIGEHMQDHVRRFNLSEKPRRLLVGGMRARQLLIATPLLKWYLEHGLIVSKVYQVVEYKPQACFREFVRDVSDARRLGDSDPSKSILADTRKLEGNSAYGSTIMDVEKFQTVKYVQGDGEAMREANLPQFKKLTSLLGEEAEYYEIEKSKSRLKINLPIQIGYFILQYAKLHMLQFYYDFMDRYVERSDFEYCEMDTDSAYMALAGPSLEAIIKPEMRERYRASLQGYCDPHVEVSADARHHWFPRTCCPAHTKHDQRTPGLFKLEFQGDTIIGLCSKTYIVSKTEIVKTTSTTIAATRILKRVKRLKTKPRPLYSKIVKVNKFSCKGISKRLVKAPFTIFRRVLTTQTPGQGLNRGFRARDNGISTYDQKRNGFSYFYCKRKVLADGVTTVPLDLELCPIPAKKEVGEVMGVETAEPEIAEVEVVETYEEEEEEEEVDDAYLIHLLETEFESDVEDDP